MIFLTWSRGVWDALGAGCCSCSIVRSSSRHLQTRRIFHGVLTMRQEEHRLFGLYSRVPAIGISSGRLKRAWRASYIVPTDFRGGFRSACSLKPLDSRDYRILDGFLLVTDRWAGKPQWSWRGIGRSCNVHELVPTRWVQTVTAPLS